MQGAIDKEHEGKSREDGLPEGCFLRIKVKKPQKNA
jgi:hypothetical protein